MILTKKNTNKKLDSSQFLLPLKITL